MRYRSNQFRVVMAMALVATISACATGGVDEPEDGSTTVAQEEPTTLTSETDDSSSMECSNAELLRSLADMSQEEREASLLDAARQESGTLGVHTSTQGEEFRELFEAFNDAYALDLTLAVYNGSSEEVLQRTLQEGQAGRLTTDVYDNHGAEMVVVADEGWLTPINSPYEMELFSEMLPEPNQDGERLFLPNRLQVWVAAWNTEYVDTADVPADWLGFADPRWDGVLTIEAGNYDWFATLVNYYVNVEGMAEEDVVDTFREILAMSSSVSGHTGLTELVALGEVRLGLTQYLHIVQRHLMQDASAPPIEWIPAVEPIVVTPQMTGLMCDAVNPATGMLFIDWWLSADGGQRMVVEFGRDPANASTEGGVLDERIAEGATVIPLDVNAVLSESDKWVAIWEELLLETQPLE